jgi:hypothetical protein
MAWQFSLRYLGDGDAITQSFKRNYEEASKEIERVKVRTEEQKAKHELFRQKQRHMSATMRQKMMRGSLITATQPAGVFSPVKQSVISASHGYRMQR